jgi:phosphatidylserine/phosphatidylglycerophosphate/cardiolipin synthase-like enzyme
LCPEFPLIALFRIARPLLCYLNEELCIITSLNLYEFSQVNNNEMGILIRRADDGQLYKDAYEEAQRIIRISDEVRISLERVANPPDRKAVTGKSMEAGAPQIDTSSDAAEESAAGKLVRRSSLRSWGSRPRNCWSDLLQRDT